MTDSLTRKKFVARGALTVGALGVPALARAAMTKVPKTHPVYRLDHRSEHCGHADGSCATCKKYDAAFIFPTRKAANGNRAHKGCNCCIQQGRIHYGTYVALFGNPKKLKHYRADKRTKRVKALLRHHKPVFA